MLAAYEYTPWGKLLGVKNADGNAITSSGHAAIKNPLRYRGYYYDIDSGFYYLQSRYYDPQIGRFINVDSQLNTAVGILGFNLIAYCNNNPTKMMSGEIMDREKFIKQLEEHGINPNMVSFEDNAADGYGIRKNYFRWEVFLRERGKEYICIGFPSESDALIYLLDRLVPIYKKINSSN